MVTDPEVLYFDGYRYFFFLCQDMSEHALLYLKLADHLAAAIREGRLLSGSRLLSVRDCAKQKKLSINTVTTAYRLLEDKGLIEARPKSGYFVKSRLPVPLQPIQPTKPTERQPDTLNSFIQAVLTHQNQAGYTDFGLACPRGKAFYPAERLSKLTASILRQQHGLVAQYALPPGSLSLRQQIGLRLAQLGMSVTPEELILTHGALDALNLAIRTVAKAGDTVLLETPTYFNLYSLLEMLGIQWKEITTDPVRGMDLDELENVIQRESIAAIITIPTVHNPLGFTMSRTDKQRLASLANQYQIPVIEDAQHADLQFVSPPEPLLKAYDTDGWVMTCASYTKTLAPDFRIGWIAPGRFLEPIRRLKFLTSVAESTLLSEAIAKFLENGGYERHLRHVRRLYAMQIDHIRNLIADHFPAGTKASLPTGGFILWLELPETINSLELAQRAMQEHIVCIPGQLYSSNRRYQHCLRLTCCFEMNEQYATGLRRLGQLAHELQTYFETNRIKID